MHHSPPLANGDTHIQYSVSEIRCPLRNFASGAKNSGSRGSSAKLFLDRAPFKTDRSLSPRLFPIGKIHQLTNSTRSPSLVFWVLPVSITRGLVCVVLSDFDETLERSFGLLDSQQHAGFTTIQQPPCGQNESRFRAARNFVRGTYVQYSNRQ